MAPAEQQGPTGVVMLNMGGPSSLYGEDDGVEPFLRNLFSDPEIIPLGALQDTLVRLPTETPSVICVSLSCTCSCVSQGPFIARRRAPKVAKQYEAIGGKSPILKWTEAQGKAMCELLNAEFSVVSHFFLCVQ
jgi:protoporphyrin/coproporphyrin ferrochelatase